MTEEDTFLALKRPSIHEVVAMVLELQDNSRDDSIISNMFSMGWTEEEYNATWPKYYKRNGSRRDD